MPENKPEHRRYKVTLTEDEREQWRKKLTSGNAAARQLHQARILLYADQDVAGLRRHMHPANTRKAWKR